MYPRIPKITVARSNRSVNTSIVVMRSPPFGGNNLFHIPVGAPIISCAPVFVNLPPPGGFFIFCALQLSHRYSVCLGDDHHLLPVAISPGIGPVRSGGGKGEKQCDSSDSLAEKSTGRNEISGTWNGQPRIEYGCPLDACGLFGGSCFLCS